MPRYRDQWVVDRSNFEFVSGGTCACCGFSHLLLPEGLRGLISEVTDLETDAANAEFDAAQQSPWPPLMRDQVWGDRVKLRQLMKREMEFYKEVFAASKRDQVLDFIRTDIGPEKMRQMLQMGREEVTDRVRTKYGIHSAYAVVLCAVVDQVANFPVTKYPTDARGEEETCFEQTLVYDRRGGFMFPIADINQDENKYQFNETNLEVLMNFFISLGGPKLLKREPRRGHSGDSDDDEGGADETSVRNKKSDGPSFRSDRRITRLLIARNWADMIIAKMELKYKNEEIPKEQNNIDEQMSKDIENLTTS